MMRLLRFGAGAVLACALAAALGYAYVGDIAAATFITAPVERGTIASAVKATGTVEAVLMVDVSSQLSGRIAEVFVNFNDNVRAGQPLARLDGEIFLARVNEAGAALKVARATAQVQHAAFERAKVAVMNARTSRDVAEAQSAAIRARQDEVEREFQRKLALAGTGSASERELSQARAQRDTGAADLRGSLAQIRMRADAIAIAEAEQRMAEASVENAEAVIEQQQAALDQARLDVERTVLRAPIDGVIIKRDVNPGQTVAVSLEARTLFRIANDLHEMQVHGKIDEADVGRLSKGQIVQFTVDAYPDRTFSGQVLQVRKSPETVQNVVTYTAIISAPNTELLLLPGMTAVLKIVVNETGASLKIPNEALRFRPVGSGPVSTAPPPHSPGSSGGSAATVWVVGSDGRPRARTVTIADSDDSGTRMLEGRLSEGDQVIVGTASPPPRTGLFGLRLGF